MTANFPDEPSNRESTSHLRHEKEPDLVSKGQYTNAAGDAAADRPLMINETSTVNTMRNTRVNTHRSNSMSNLHSLQGVNYLNNNGNGTGYNQASDKSRGMSPQHDNGKLLLAGDRGRESPLRSNKKQAETPKIASSAVNDRDMTGSYGETAQERKVKTAFDNSMAEDSKMDANAYAMNNIST